MVDELDDDVLDVSSLEGVADGTDDARPIVGTLDGVAVTALAYEAVLRFGALDDEAPDDTCACRCGCQHSVGAHAPGTCQDCRHGRHRGSMRRGHR